MRDCGDARVQHAAAEMNTRGNNRSRQDMAGKCGFMRAHAVDSDAESNCAENQRRSDRGGFDAPWIFTPVRASHQPRCHPSHHMSLLLPALPPSTPGPISRYAPHRRQPAHIITATQPLLPLPTAAVPAMSASAWSGVRRARPIMAATVRLRRPRTSSPSSRACTSSMEKVKGCPFMCAGEGAAPAEDLTSHIPTPHCPGHYSVTEEPVLPQTPTLTLDPGPKPWPQTHTCRCASATPCGVRAAGGTRRTRASITCPYPCICTVSPVTTSDSWMAYAVGSRTTSKAARGLPPLPNGLAWCVPDETSPSWRGLAEEVGWLELAWVVDGVELMVALVPGWVMVGARRREGSGCLPSTCAVMAATVSEYRVSRRSWSVGHTHGRSTVTPYMAKYGCSWPCINSENVLVNNLCQVM